MPDQEFENPRLAEIYDLLDSDRGDLIHYIDLIEKFDARSVLDVGCGTGSLLCLLAGKGYTLTGIDPASASLDVARRKDGAENVKWILGDSSSAFKESADVAVMTGNVAQVFTSDSEWFVNLSNIYEAIRPKGHLIFESRDPKKRAWENWNPKTTKSEKNIPGVGSVVSWLELTDISMPLISFQWTFHFKQDGAVLTSNSTLCFRQRDEIESSLNKTGFNLVEVRDAPDRPGRELVFIALKSEK